MQTIDNLQNEVAEAKKMTEDISCPVDRADGGYQAQLLGKVEMFGKQLQKARQVLEVLNRIQVNEQLDKVDFGAVVITESQKMFISVSLGKIKVDGEYYYIISPVVPVYKAIQGKRAGETFLFNDKKQEIVDVF